MDCGSLFCVHDHNFLIIILHEATHVYMEALKAANTKNDKLTEVVTFSKKH